MATIAFVPTGNAEVAQVAVRDEVSVTVEQPLMVVPSEVKLTVPVGTGGPAGVTVALKVTDWPKVEGFGLEVNAVVVSVPVPVLTPCDRLPLLPS